ncbi:hypothetical protein pb186bvf_011348 [Paramecium bursaria]
MILIRIDKHRGKVENICVKGKSIFIKFQQFSQEFNIFPYNFFDICSQLFFFLQLLIIKQQKTKQSFHNELKDNLNKQCQEIKVKHFE